MRKGSDLEARRTEACRLDPALALDRLDEAVTFLDERGLLTLTPCCSLPSLFGACHEEPHSPGKPGYGQYPRTRWWWGGALAETPGVVPAKIHQGKTLYLSGRLVGLVDPLARAETAHAEAGEHGPVAARITAHLAAAGPSTTDDLKLELGLDPRAYQRGRRALERRGVVVSRHVTVDAAGGGHRHLAELARWDQLVDTLSDMTADEALAQLLVAAVEAAVVLPAREARQAFAWPIPEAMVDDAVTAGRVVRLPDGRLASGP